MNHTKTYDHSNPFILESGQTINNLRIAYHTYGQLNEDKSNVIWVFHAISANSDVMDWWPGLFGNRCLYDPESYFIICANSLGSPYGSSRPNDLDFPQFTLRDVIQAHLVLARHLNIRQIHTIIGGSFGGNQTLEFGYSFQGEIQHMILIASCSRESAWGIAVHEAQRIALQSDSTFGQVGGGEAGMKAARSMAMLTYRTADAFIEQQTDKHEKLDNFRAASYIQYQGDKFVKRFDSLCYYYLTKCLDSHHIGRDRGGESKALASINIPTLIIGISSDVLIPPRFQKFMSEYIPNSNYEEISSDFGHDGFLVETKKITSSIQSFYQKNMIRQNGNNRKILKFGGSSLANGDALDRTIGIIQNEIKHTASAIVVSARGKSTNQLIRLFELATSGKNYTKELFEFIQYQKSHFITNELDDIFDSLSSYLNAISIIQTKDESAHDQIVSFGEIISAKTITILLKRKGINAIFIDARKIIHTHLILDDFQINLEKSQAATKDLFYSLNERQVPIITGYIAQSEQGKTVTLGRNGSNYTATLIASFIDATEVQNWTDVDGIYSANPKQVPDAVRIDTMSYREANELANFGTSVLHPKTILPLMQSSIPLRIKSSLQPDAPGTLINKQGNTKGIKAISVLEDVALVSLEGNGLQGKVGIDGRIFSILSERNISVRLISQASSERGIGFVIDKKDAHQTELILNQIFEEEIKAEQISNISINKDIAIIAIVGRHNYSLEKAIKGLRKNKVWMHLISNSISGEHISLVVDNKRLKKAVRVVHNEVFGAIKKLHLFAFGKGNVGSELIHQILNTKTNIIQERNLNIKIIGIADSKKYIFQNNGIKSDWKEQLSQGENYTHIDEILSRIRKAGIENVVIADNTNAKEISLHYPQILKKGFDIVASNKVANSVSYSHYQKIRNELKNRGRLFYYETNVGAGLPIIDTLKNLYQSSDKVTSIRGIFSGSLSYLFNQYSVSQKSFSEILLEAKDKGFTEPDPREDLSGNDMGRKLIILAREIGLEVEFDAVRINNLIPESLRNIKSYEDFIAQKNILDQHYHSIKSDLRENEVLRYVGELDAIKKELVVSLVKVDASSPLGNIKNADSIFEIYTEGYGEQPIILQGAGAGPVVTARGVYSDLLRIGAQM